MSKTDKQLQYEKIYAINDDNGAIVKLKDHGYALVPGAEKKKKMAIHVADFAMDFLKFDPYGAFKKIMSDSEIPLEVIENIKHNIDNAETVYGVLHPGLKIEGIE